MKLGMTRRGFRVCLVSRKDLHLFAYLLPFLNPLSLSALYPEFVLHFYQKLEEKVLGTRLLPFFKAQVYLALCVFGALYIWRWVYFGVLLYIIFQAVFCDFFHILHKNGGRDR